VNSARDILAKRNATADAIALSQAILSRLPAILQYASRWEREARWRHIRLPTLAAAAVAAACAVAFAWSANPPTHALVNGPLPVSVNLNPSGWKELFL
jgi:hypothetical protein